MGILKGRAAIVGVGETKHGKVPEMNSLQLHVDAAKKALEDAGLTTKDIDGVLTVNSVVATHRAHSVIIAEYIGIKPVFSTAIMIGGASNCAMAIHAAEAIECGIANTILCVGADNMLTGMGMAKATEEMTRVSHPSYEAPYGPSVPACFGQIACRFMHQYGITSEDLAQIAVSIRKNASLHPDAEKRELITIEDVLNSRMIATPLHLLDCALVSDGGGAFIVTSAERAKDLKKPPVYLLGGGEGHACEHISGFSDLTDIPLRLAADRAYEMAGLTPKDIDVAELYDAFTIVAAAGLVCCGFCKPEGLGDFLKGGRIEVGGEFPVTTHGGLLSHSHIGLGGGIFHITEAVKQLRGEAEGERQIKDCNIALVSGFGGRATTSSAIILGKEVA